LYARVSTDQQGQGGTIASQVEALQEWLGRAGLILDPELQFIDEGYSATTLVRPALERLRDVWVHVLRQTGPSLDCPRGATILCVLPVP